MAYPITDTDIVNVSAKYGVPADIVRYVFQRESSSGQNTANSPKGAIGPMQLMPETARELGVDPYDPKQNLEGGVKYLSQLYNQYGGDAQKTLAGYNAGPGAVNKYDGVPPYKETQDYVNGYRPQQKQPDLADMGRKVAEDSVKKEVKRQAGNYAEQQVASQTGGAVVDSTITVAPGQAMPAGYTAVGTAEGGGTLAAPSSVAGQGAATASPFALSGIGSAGNAILPAAGAYGAYDMIKNKDHRKGGRGLAQGTASGAAIGSYFGPQGAAIGAGIGLGASGSYNTYRKAREGDVVGSLPYAAATALVSPMAAMAALGGGLLNAKPRTKIEEKRWAELEKQGIAQMPDWVRNDIDIKAKDAGYRPDLAADFVGVAPNAGQSSNGIADNAGDWVNNKFAKSRNVGDLSPEDIWGYAAFSEKFGPNWMQTSEANRRNIAQKALDMGIVSEGKGTIKLKDSEDFQKYATSVLNGSQPTVQTRPMNIPQLPNVSLPPGAVMQDGLGNKGQSGISSWANNYTGYDVLKYAKDKKVKGY